MFTHHSQARMQQRSVPASAVNQPMDYGETRRDQGADAVFLTKRSRNMVLRHFEKTAFRELEKSLNAYLSAGDEGAVITAEHRYHRFKFC